MSSIQCQFNTLATWHEEPTHWKRLWCWERLKTKGKETAEDEMVREHHRFSGHEFEQTLADPVGFLSQEDLLEKDRLPTLILLGFPWGSASKESTCNAGDLGSIPGLGRSTGEGSHYLLPYSDLENSRDFILLGVAKVGHDWATLTFTFWETVKDRDPGML